MTTLETPDAWSPFLADTVTHSLLADHEKGFVVGTAVRSMVAEGRFGLWLLLTKRIQEDPSCL